MTIIEAIKSVLQEAKSPLTVDQIYKNISDKKLYGFKAKDPKSVVRSQLRRHCHNLDFPSASPLKNFKMVGRNKYALIESPISDKKVIPVTDGEKLPEEHIQEAHRKHVELIKQQLLETIQNSPPIFFSNLVVQLLVKMGYGYGDGAGKVTDGVGDGGIDGVILQDKLGLDKIYIQAKRYASNNTVKINEVRELAGALQSVTKGIFITTSAFPESAKRFVSTDPKTIVLIDGDKLAELMIDYGLGVTEVKAVSIFKIDENYFSG
jgi:restriction system protein